MLDRRRKRGFEPGGAFPPEQLGLPRGRARELMLHRAWRRLVGPMAEKARPLELRRGTLLLELAASDGGERRALQEMLPTLVGRLAATCPRLGIRRFGLVGPDGDRSAPTRTVAVPDLVDDGWFSAGGESPVGRRRDGERSDDDAGIRLNRVMERCLARTQKP